MRIADFLLGSIPLIIDFYARQYLQDDLSKTMTELASEFNMPKIKTYDFIIVGGGTAGCVLAGRLSENFNVLLLEAGGTPPPVGAVPWFAVDIAADTSINYFFHTTLKDDAPRNTGGNLTVHTGKMLGGSGSHNDMVHSRGSPMDYDNWGTLTNDSSWNYENVVQFFKKSENFVGQRYGPEDHAEYYGTDGPITVQLNEVPLQDLWFQAGRELGFGVNDPNGFQNISFAPMHKAVGLNGQRSSSFSEYVQRYENTRESLTVIRYANVSEILLDAENRAYGVAYMRHSVFPQIAHASKEIIVSAGTYSSPLLLMKSGIGPEEMLKAAEIPVKVPIEAMGKNLGEHPSIILSGFTVNDTSLFMRLLSTEIEDILGQFHKGDGILTKTWEGPQCFIASNQSEKETWPDIWIAMAPSFIIDDAEASVGFYSVIGRPKSRGTLSLHTENYKRGIRDDTLLAVIDYNFMSHPDDIETMLEAIKFVFQIVETTTAFKSLNMTYNDQPLDTCSDHVFRSDEYWRCVILQQTLSWIHMVGTNSMGPDLGSSTDTVVDNQLRVRGVKGLRVVDASVIPAVTNANLNAPILMLAEKAADLIRQEWYTEVPPPSKGTLCYSNISITFIFVTMSMYLYKLI